MSMISTIQTGCWSPQYGMKRNYLCKLKEMSCMFTVTMFVFQLSIKMISAILHNFILTVYDNYNKDMLCFPKYLVMFYDCSYKFIVLFCKQPGSLTNTTLLCYI